MNDPMNCLLTCLMLALPSLACEAQAGENVLKDGGLEQYLDRPDEEGNPFKVWSGWKWEGNCRRVADTDIKHEGQASAEMLSYGACKLGISQTVKTEAGWYILSGYVRAIHLKTGLYDRGLVVSFEPKGKELMTDLPTGTYGWREFKLTGEFEEPCERNLLYIYLFGSGKVWLDELRLEKVEGAGLKNGLVLGPVEETLRGFPGDGGIPCSFCGLKVDSKAANCGVCGAQSPIRFLTPEGKHVSGLEYRAIKTSDGALAFVNNLDRKRDQQVKLTANLPFSMLNLTLETDSAPSFAVPAGETYILKLKQP